MICKSITDAHNSTQRRHVLNNACLNWHSNCQLRERSVGDQSSVCSGPSWINKCMHVQACVCARTRVRSSVYFGAIWKPNAVACTTLTSDSWQPLQWPWRTRKGSISWMTNHLPLKKMQFSGPGNGSGASFDEFAVVNNCVHPLSDRQSIIHNFVHWHVRFAPYFHEARTNFRSHVRCIDLKLVRSRTGMWDV